MVIAILPLRKIAMELSFIFHQVLELETETFPEVSVEMAPPTESDIGLHVRWADRSHIFHIPREHFAWSLDQFSETWCWPIVAELCGKPLWDGRSIVVNAVHDERAAA